MTRISTVALALLLLCTTAFAKPIPETRAERVNMSSERLTVVDDLMEQYVDNKQLAGIVTLVARDGKIVQYKAYGQKGADDPRPMGKTDLFRIYSMSKPITAAAAMQLYEKGKFRLSDPVTKFVPELKDMKVRLDDGSLVDVERPMTMLQLLTHTAGLGYGLNQRHPTEKMYADAKLFEAKDLDEFAERVGKLPLRYQPGDRWHYSVAVDITGLVVQRISGQPFDEYLAEHIFKPLGMEDTFFEVPADKVDRFLPNHYYDRKNAKLVTIDESPGAAMRDYKKVTLFSGGGGLISTAMDYLRFAEAMRRGGELDGNRILGAKTVNFMASNHLPTSLGSVGSGEQPTQVFNRGGTGFGLGFSVVVDPVATSALGSQGEFSWGGAAGTVFWIDPVEQIVVVGMIQLMASPFPLRDDLRVGTYQAITKTYE
ncbi:MAG: serine hydrolase domain-containing protein [Pseudomonadota bacterium]